ncbi:Transcriptional activator spt7 [Agyrium rufum]|nr:Transcriptional activator spt7 [Agyrium rufum]
MSFHINSTPTTLHADGYNALHVNGFHRSISRARSPNIFSQHRNGSTSGNATEVDMVAEDDPRTALFKTMFARNNAKIETLFKEQAIRAESTQGVVGTNNGEDDSGEHEDVEETQPPPTIKKPARAIDEDDYDDDDDDEDAAPNKISPLKSKSTSAAQLPRVVSPAKAIPYSHIQPPPSAPGPSTQWQGKTSDDARKKLEADKKEAEENAKRSFQTMFYPIDNDRDAMLEQQRLEESERQVDVEVSGQENQAAAGPGEGTLSQANLGASSLVLKNLIARIDATRERVKASDQELRNLMIEVKKNRSKWASEDKIGQEELYEAAEKVLSEIKAFSAHAQPFLTKVNKRDAPDYHAIIKHPMDLSLMTKKLKQFGYKSKKDFVDDLNLIWANCLRYNTNPEHFLRKHALFMRKETEKLVPLIPDIVIRDRAEVEAEERRAHAAENQLDGGEDSDDEPIIASRGRKAPGKVAKKGNNARKSIPGTSTPDADVKPALLNGLSNLNNELLRADSEHGLDGSQTGMATPPPGSATPMYGNGLRGSVPPGSQVDSMDIDGPPQNLSNAPEADYDDFEYRTWKQVTKRDRALVAAERHRLFRPDGSLNPEEPALLRTKAGMRRFMRNVKDAKADNENGEQSKEGRDEKEKAQTKESLAEGMEDTEEKVLPDYYDIMSAVPDLPSKLAWIEDSEGQLLPPSEDLMRIIPKGLFTAKESMFSKKVGANMKQMQETRKTCNKISVVKQMQQQSQMYQNQFQKYAPEPFHEQDIEPHVLFDDGPVMDHNVCRATMQRSIGKIFYHAGFEEFQPSALEAMTDIANDYFVKLSRSLAELLQTPKIPVPVPPSTVAIGSMSASETEKIVCKSKYTLEESILMTLQENGTDLEALENYVKEDADRTGTKLTVVHDRMKAHLAELLRPALADGGPDGANAFHDGSEQFVGGDFAEDLDEDFFGFKELGLDKEFGLASLTVPLHLLQNRMHNAYQAQNTSSATTLPTALETPKPYTQVTSQNYTNEIGLMHAFFAAKLAANNNQALVEDEDLPQKQRFPKPRLPPSGKISSPRKKPVREPGPGKGHPRKKMKFIESEGWVRDEGMFVGGKDKTKEKEKDRKDEKDEKDEKDKDGSGSGSGSGGGGGSGSAKKTDGGKKGTGDGDPAKVNGVGGGGEGEGKGLGIDGVGDSALRRESTYGDGSMNGEMDVDADGEADEGGGREKTLTNGVHGNGVVNGKMDVTPTKDSRGKKRDLDGAVKDRVNEGGMISPESLEAT